MSRVTIYRFRRYDIESGENIVSPRWGTLEAIKALNPRCETLLNTATEVDASVVDSDHPGLTVRDYEPPRKCLGVEFIPENGGGVGVRLRDGRDKR